MPQVLIGMLFISNGRSLLLLLPPPPPPLLLLLLQGCCREAQGAQG
jgi:hypothetical protein